MHRRLFDVNPFFFKSDGTRSVVLRLEKLRRVAEKPYRRLASGTLLDNRKAIMVKVTPDFVNFLEVCGSFVGWRWEFCWDGSAEVSSVVSIPDGSAIRNTGSQ
jgi:hypothetical protein